MSLAYTGEDHDAKKEGRALDGRFTPAYGKARRALPQRERA